MRSSALTTGSSCPQPASPIGPLSASNVEFIRRTVAADYCHGGFDVRHQTGESVAPTKFSEDEKAPIGANDFRARPLSARPISLLARVRSRHSRFGYRVDAAAKPSSSARNQTRVVAIAIWSTRFIFVALLSRIASARARARSLSRATLISRNGDGADTLCNFSITYQFART